MFQIQQEDWHLARELNLLSLSESRLLINPQAEIEHLPHTGNSRVSCEYKLVLDITGHTSYCSLFSMYSSLMNELLVHYTFYNWRNWGSKSLKNILVCTITRT